MTGSGGSAVTAFDVKVGRLTRLAQEAGVAALLLVTHSNFSWLSGGATNRIDGSGEVGEGGLLVAADGRRFVLANRIEMPRLLDEALHGLQFDPCEFPWTAEHMENGVLMRTARTMLGSGAEIGADVPVEGARPMAAAIARSRVPLTVEEIDRYIRLGHDVGRRVGDLCSKLEPGLSEMEVAAQASSAMALLDARPVVTLVGADDRISNYRHPVPTQVRWRKRLLVGLCVEREGLVVALSRLVSGERVPEDLTRRTAAAADVFADLLSATRPGATGAQLFAAAATAYARHGFSGEEARHHQGGAIGYRPRDWIAHPASEEVVRTPQAFAWNPSVTGTKVEDTAIVSSDGVELITSSPGWPSTEKRVGRHTLAIPDVLRL